MVHSNLTLTLLLAISASSLFTLSTCQNNPSLLPSTDPNQPPSPTNVTNRTARIMKYLSDPKTLQPAKRFRMPHQIRARADQVAPPQRLAPAYRRAPPPPAAPPAYMSPRPQLMRRAHNPPGPNQRFVYESGAKNTRFSLSSKGGGGVPFNAGKPGGYRAPFAPMHPNAVAPQPTGQLQQQQKQYQQQQQQQQQHQHQQYNFKASPPFNGQAIVRPVNEPHVDSATYGPHFQQPQPVPQYPIPVQPQNPNTRLSAGYLSQQQKQLQTAYQQLFHYERPREEPVLQPHNKHEQLPERGAAGYAVYESDELFETHIPSAQPIATNHNYFISSTEAGGRDAQDYLKFMNSNEYFLPKRDPNYRQLDAAKDLQTPYKQQYFQSASVIQQQQKQQQQQQQQQQQSASASQASIQYSKAMSSDSSTFHNKPIQVSQLFYQADPVPHRQSSISTPTSSAAIVRGSYQAGNNMFVVNSDGNKAVKHIVQSPAPPAITPTTTSAPKRQYNVYPRPQTPEPVRFEFTERDAVTASYTNAPAQTQQHLRYKAVSVVTPSTPQTPTLSTAGSVYDGGDDEEDNEDIHEASATSYGRVPLGPPLVTAAAPTNEQKDTEDYCERVCSNVQDDDEEIVCGSDGYMYTSEAQMECYASCLHIDVTIQGKGSCSGR